MAITLFTIPREVFINGIVPQLPNLTMLSVRLVSKTAKKWIYLSMKGPHRDIDLNGKEVTIFFEGSIKKKAPAFFLHRLKMTCLSCHPELLATLESARSTMRNRGKAGPCEIQDYLGSPAEKEMALALTAFDFKTKALQIQRAHPFLIHFGGLPLALVAAAQKNSIELVSLVLAHPNAQFLEQSHLKLALFNISFQNIVPPQNPHVDQRIRLALLSHPNAAGLKLQEAQYTLAVLETMLSDPTAQYTLGEFAIVLMQLPEQSLRKLQ